MTSHATNDALDAESDLVPYYPMPRSGACPFAPHATLRKMAASGAPAKVRIWDDSTPWIVTGHADQRALLLDARMSNNEKAAGYPHMTRGRSETAKHTPPMITNTDAPEHTRLRRLVNGPFLAKRIEALRPKIQQVVDERIDDLLAGPKPVDLVKTFGLPVPTLVICDLLGVPYDDHEFFQDCSNRCISHSSSEQEAAEASAALAGKFGELIELKMKEPANDVLSQMGAFVTSGQMTHLEAILQCTAMLIAGHETTASMISLGTLALLQNPDQLAQLRERWDEPAFVANAVEELLRYLTIVHSGIRRIATEPVEVGGVRIEAGDGVIFDLASANYDPAAFPDPDTLDLTRPARTHHAFGVGPHQCLGQSLARVELQVVYSTLYRRIPGLALAEPDATADVNFDGVAYGLHSLPVTW